MLRQEFDQPELGADGLHSEFVPVVFAAGPVQARRYKAVLEANNITVQLESERGDDAVYGAFARAIPVLVPGHMHDRASDLVANAERCSAAAVRCADAEEAADSEEENLDDEFEDEFDDDDDLDDDLDDDFEEDDDDFEEEEEE